MFFGGGEAETGGVEPAGPCCCEDTMGQGVLGALGVVGLVGLSQG